MKKTLWAMLAAAGVLVLAASPVQVSAQGISGSVSESAKTVESGSKTGFYVAENGKTWYRKNGKNVTGWVKVNGYKYYIDAKKGMRKNTWVDGHYLDTQGRMVKNQFVTLKSGTYYLNSKGKKKTGWLTLNYSKYYFGSNGKQVFGLKKIKGSTYYFDKDNGGAMLTNTSKKINGKRYLFNEDGRANWAKKQFVTVNGSSYYLNSKGRVATGFVKKNGKTYYFGKTGKQVFGMKWIDSHRYYFDYNDGGAMVVSTLRRINGVTYSFNARGYSKKEALDSNSLGLKIAEYARSFVGNEYLYGGNWSGELPYTATDCSGFVHGVYTHFGMNVARTAAALADETSSWYDRGTVVSVEDLKPGDLVFYYTPISHVAIYIGNGQVVHASNSRPYPAGGVKISDYDYTDVVKCVRYWQ